MRSSNPPTRSDAGDLLCVGFGAAAAMWTVGYFARLAGDRMPAPVVFVLVLAVLPLAGWIMERIGGGPMRRTLLAGGVTGLLNLLVLFSLFDRKNPNLISMEMLRLALIWSPSCVLLCAFGVWIGAQAARAARPRRPMHGPPNWRQGFGLVTLGATAVLLVIGGNVTGFQAGLAVPDWPNSYGYNMFLYPLARMTGGIYFEHSHRLFGALVGLTTVTLAVFLWRVDRRPLIRGLATAAVVMVIVQGVMGGLRVTGRLTMSAEAEHLAPSTTLAVAHGVFAQLFFSTLAVLTAALSTTWRDAAAVCRTDAGLDRSLTLAAAAAVLLQLFLGALLRHISWGLMVHLGFAAAVLILVGLAGFRTWGNYEDIAVISRTGKRLLLVLMAQLMLGATALVAIMSESQTGGTHAWHVLVTTAHQTTGAILMATSVVLAAWLFRLTRVAAEPSPHPSEPGCPVEPAAKTG